MTIFFLLFLRIACVRKHIINIFNALCLRSKRNENEKNEQRVPRPERSKLTGAHRGAVVAREDDVLSVVRAHRARVFLLLFVQFFSPKF